MSINQRHADMLAREYSQDRDGPYAKVLVQCECGTRAIHGLRINPQFAALMRTLNIPADSVVGSAWCRHCENSFKVTARDLKFTAS